MSSKYHNIKFITIILANNVLSHGIDNLSALEPASERAACHVPSAMCRVLRAACHVQRAKCSVSRVMCHVPGHIVVTFKRHGCGDKQVFQTSYQIPLSIFFIHSRMPLGSLLLIDIMCQALTAKI